jgi:hypothetical protein
VVVAVVAGEGVMVVVAEEGVGPSSRGAQLVAGRRQGGHQEAGVQEVVVGAVAMVAGEDVVVVKVVVEGRVVEVVVGVVGVAEAGGRRKSTGALLEVSGAEFGL